MLRRRRAGKQICHQNAQPVAVPRRTLKRRNAEGWALGNLGLAYAALGDSRRAIEFYQQNLQIARETGDRRGEGTTLGNLGLAYVALGETHHAIGFLSDAL